MSVKRTAFLLATVGILFSASVARAQDSNPAVILEWNQVLQQTPAVATGVPGVVGGPLMSRSYAMVHIAMFDAANSIARAYTPFHVSVAASSGASLEAAAAQAAHDVMTGLFPAQQAAFDATLNARLATIEPGRRSQGVAVGKAAAARVLAWRADDGSSDVGPVYAPPLVAGQWQPTVPGANATLTQVPAATPFALVSTTQFLPSRHPEINSPAYAADFNEVKSLGHVNSVTRTPYQTETALLWAGVSTVTSTNLFQIWNSVMRDTVSMQHLSLLEAARGFALLGASMYDGILTSMTAKLTYGLWRQWDAIRRAGDDLNPATEPDLTWSPLLATPPYPTYPGNMACLGAAAARSLQLVAGTDTAHLSVTWKGPPPNPDATTYTREYHAYSQLAQEEADSRIYGGIHFRFDNVASQAQCAKVAEWVAARVKPRR